MKGYLRNILIASAVLMAAVSCNKNLQDGSTLSDAPILLSPTEAGATKALLSSDTFKNENSQIQIYDFYTSGNSTEIYISDQIKAPKEESDTWPFVNKRYNWTPGGEHKFFGWLFDDKYSNLKAEDLFGETFKPTVSNSAVTTVVDAFDTENQVLTIPVTTMNQSSPQFDFMYSNVHIRDLDTNPDFATAVPLEFGHLFTAFSVAAQNMSPNFKVTIVSVSIEGLMNTRSATLDYDYENIGDEDYPIITYADKSNDNAAVADFIWSKPIELDDALVDISTGSPENREYFLSWPMSVEESENVTITVSYKIDDSSEIISKPISLSGQEWVAGKKNNVNLIFKDKEIKLICEVEPWKWEQHEIDFTDVVSVTQTMKDKWENVYSVDYNTGIVILKQSKDQIASVKFQIDSPRGATWTASLIMIEGATDAVQFVDGYKYGKVGEPGEIRLRVAKDTPKENRNSYYLRITVQTADGNTIIATGLTGNNNYEEFQVIQNLI